EMSHVRLRHGTANASKGGMLEALGQIAGGVLGNGAAGSLARLGTQIGVGSVLLKFSRDYEREADLLGTDLMYDTGYNPQAMADFFQKLDKEGGSRGPQFLSDHPNPGNRSAYVADEVRHLEPRSYRGNSNDWASIKSRAGSTKTYTAKQIADGQFTPTGVTGPGSNGGSVQPAAATTGAIIGGSNGIAPSSNIVVYENNAFHIKRPDNWGPQESQNQVVIAPQAGLVENGIAYGVLISGSQGGGSDLDSGFNSVLQQIISSQQGSKQIGGTESISVNKVPARMAYLRGVSPVSSNGKQLSERDWVVGLPRGNDILY